MITKPTHLQLLSYMIVVVVLSPDVLERETDTMKFKP